MNTADELKLLANAFEESGNYEFALNYYRRALIAAEQMLGKDNPELCQFIYELAMIYAALEQENEARNLIAWLSALLPNNDPLNKEIDIIISELDQSRTAA